LPVVPENSRQDPPAIRILCPAIRAGTGPHYKSAGPSGQQGKHPGADRRFRLAYLGGAGGSQPAGRDAAWELFSQARRIAWKTGTSFGNRDAWAVGTTPGYVVGVWAGNASGEGRPGLTGIGSAAPLMFRLFDILPPDDGWFMTPYDQMEQAAVCRQSGHRAGPLCTPDTVWIHRRGLDSSVCPWHRLVHLDRMGGTGSPLHVNLFHRSGLFHGLSCLPSWNGSTAGRIHPICRFRLSGRGACGDSSGTTVMDLVYPSSGTTIFIPRELDGTRGRAVFELAHREAGATVYWHLDGEYLGHTTGLHQMELSPGPGIHSITVVDNGGNTLERVFRVAGD
jgi:penicillin-binding protein 1C